MTFADRVEALGFLGLTPRQTRFVVTVALHGGYCLRRQYATFAGIGYGATVRDFLDRLVRRQVMTRIAYRRDRGFLYHLHAKRIYRAIAQDDNRNRRVVSPALIARKLMLLDVVLAHPTVTWVATEADKVALFTERFGLSPADLPQRTYPSVRPVAASTLGRGDTAAGPTHVATTRYFVNKEPIFYADAEGAGARPHAGRHRQDDESWRAGDNGVRDAGRRLRPRRRRHDQLRGRRPPADRPAYRG